MPRGDGTGPAGMGPMTGRAAGFCAGYGIPGYANFAGGRGRGRGMGGGRGYRNWFFATGLPRWARGGYGGQYVRDFVPPVTEIPRQQELHGLKDQANYLENALAGIKKRIEELESQADTK